MRIIKEIGKALQALFSEEPARTSRDIATETLTNAEASEDAKALAMIAQLASQEVAANSVMARGYYTLLLEKSANYLCSTEVEVKIYLALAAYDARRAQMTAAHEHLQMARSIAAQGNVSPELLQEVQKQLDLLNRRN
jgi:predicted PolB exonuclease-like 3'-5' exonuclease